MKTAGGKKKESTSQNTKPLWINGADDKYIVNMLDGKMASLMSSAFMISAHRTCWRQGSPSLLLLVPPFLALSFPNSVTLSLTRCLALWIYSFISLRFLIYSSFLWTIPRFFLLFRDFFMYRFSFSVNYIFILFMYYCFVSQVSIRNYTQLYHCLFYI